MVHILFLSDSTTFFLSSARTFFFPLLLEREGGVGEREREREKHQCERESSISCLCKCPNRRSNPQPGSVLRPGIKLQPSVHRMYNAPTNWATLAWADSTTFESIAGKTIFALDPTLSASVLSFPHLLNGKIGFGLNFSWGYFWVECSFVLRTVVGGGSLSAFGKMFGRRSL